MVYMQVLHVILHINIYFLLSTHFYDPVFIAVLYLRETLEQLLTSVTRVKSLLLLDWVVRSL